MTLAWVIQHCVSSMLSGSAGPHLAEHQHADHDAQHFVR